MSYSEYIATGQSLGKILFTLSNIGIPIHIVSSVIHDGNNGLLLDGARFAHYYWDGDVPVFQFEGEIFKQLRQPKLYKVKFSESFTDEPDLTVEFNSKTELQNIFGSESHKFAGHAVYDCRGNIYDDDIKLICKYSTTVLEKASRLKMKFHK